MDIHPSSRHDNDHRDIRLISILPTALEICCSHKEFLPSTDFRQSHHHGDPTRRYLDTHFRLLRHDVFGPWKEVIRGLTVSKESTWSQQNDSNATAYLYQNATISRLNVGDREGLEANISFALPANLSRVAPCKRRKWWVNSKRLEKGVLVCFIHSVGEQKVPLLLTVTEKLIDLSDTPGPRSHRAVIIAKLATPGSHDLQLLLRIHQRMIRGAIIEVPGLIPATFKPILENIQNMISWPALPFQEWVVPYFRGIGRDHTPMPPPLYARKHGFSFPLNSIVRHGGSFPPLSPTASPDDMELINMLEVRTGLDCGQCQGLVAGLTRELALIQGPPGTGKTFLGVKLIRVLLSCKTKASLGPIIIA